MSDRAVTIAHTDDCKCVVCAGLPQSPPAPERDSEIVEAKRKLCFVNPLSIDEQKKIALVIIRLQEKCSKLSKESLTIATNCNTLNDAKNQLQRDIAELKAECLPWLQCLLPENSDIEFEFPDELKQLQALITKLGAK